MDPQGECATARACKEAGEISRVLIFCSRYLVRHQSHFLYFLLSFLSSPITLRILCPLSLMIDRIGCFDQADVGADCAPLLGNYCDQVLRIFPSQKVLRHSLLA